MHTSLNRTVRKSTAMVAALAVILSSFGLALDSAAIARAAAVPNWNAAGTYVLSLQYLGIDYQHDLSLVQDGQGHLSGSGGSPAGAPVYTWVISSGAVVGDTIDFLANYTASADAVTPQTVLHLTGTIATDGTLSGTWSDNYQAGNRSGTFTTSSGRATMLPGTLAAEDFGVVDYDSGLGQLRGYSAGFGLTDASSTFTGVQSVVVSLYSGTTLLQTNTATPKLGAVIVGNQISSPFDVSGTFDYATDGYWTNVRQSEFGQTMPASRVVATVTLANGKVVTAENSSLVGEPSTIYPTTPSLVKVTIEKYVDGVLATAANAHSLAFPMLAMWDATNTGSGTGSYVLSPDGFNSGTPYTAVTADMTTGARYATNERVDGDVVGAACTGSTTPFALVGYSVGDTLASALGAVVTTTAPSFANLTSDKFVIVWNQSCAPVSGTIGGTVTGDPSKGVLAVTSIDSVDTTATADGTFGSGWKYVFHITVPTNETHLSMKFADWINTTSSSTIATAGNMRISSAQADNAGATVLIAAPNTYPAPALHMTGDLSTTTPGMQVAVTVEVAVPSTTANGSYATTYGVQTLP